MKSAFSKYSIITLILLTAFTLPVFAAEVRTNASIANVNVSSNIGTFNSDVTLSCGLNTLKIFGVRDTLLNNLTVNTTLTNAHSQYLNNITGSNTMNLSDIKIGFTYNFTDCLFVETMLNDLNEGKSNISSATKVGTIYKINKDINAKFGVGLLEGSSLMMVNSGLEWSGENFNFEYTCNYDNSASQSAIQSFTFTYFLAPLLNS